MQAETCQTRMGRGMYLRRPPEFISRLARSGSKDLAAYNKIGNRRNSCTTFSIPIFKYHYQRENTKTSFTGTQVQCANISSRRFLYLISAPAGRASPLSQPRAQEQLQRCRQSPECRVVVPCTSFSPDCLHHRTNNTTPQQTTTCDTHITYQSPDQEHDCAPRAKN
jgi:hypothetical protein